MLIRRRSSSSISSGDDDDADVEFKPRELRRKSDTSKLKKPKTDDGIENESNVTETECSTSNSEEAGSTKATPSKKHPLKANVVEIRSNQYKSFTVKKTGKHVNIDLNYIDGKCHFTALVSGKALVTVKWNSFG